uniref:Lipoprotein n=1 Tax=Angiostrongylus cantonensis TaxID=6313 RepID=A0A0K0DA55_ANGCA
MTSLRNVAKAPRILLLLSLFATTAVFGCGTTPEGLATMTTRAFNTSYSLLVPTPLQQMFALSCISRSADAVKGFVTRINLLAVMVMTTPKCIIYGNTVNAVCNATCTLNTEENVSCIPPTALSISGNLTTTNIIVANWSIEMCQGLVNKVDRNLASGPFGSDFFSAFATIA